MIKHDDIRGGLDGIVIFKKGKQVINEVVAIHHFKQRQPVPTYERDIIQWGLTTIGGVSGHTKT